MNEARNIIWVAIIATIVIVSGVSAILGFDMVDASHLGVKIRMGEITGVIEPGLHWTGVLTHTEPYDLRLRKVRVDMLEAQNSATDKDGQAIFGSVSVNYKVKPQKTVVSDLYRKVGTDNYIEDKLNLKPIIKEGFKQATVEYEAMEILQNRQQVKENAKQYIKNNFPEDYFEIVDIVVEDIDFSASFKQAIESKKTATQDKLKEQEQVEVVKAQQQQEIEKYKAEAEKMRLQKQEVTSLLNEQKMIDKWDGKLPEYLIITPDSQGMLLNLAQGKGSATGGVQ